MGGCPSGVPALQIKFSLFGLGYVETIPLPWLGFLRGVFLAYHLPSTDNLTSNNQETEHIQTRTNVNTKLSPINNIITQKNLC